MPVTMSGATIDTSEREELLAKTVSGDATAGGSKGSSQGFLGLFAAGANLAGITPSFAENVSAAIEAHCEEVTTILKELEAVDSDPAFKGSSIKTALSNFIEAVRETAMTHVDKLKAAEEQIVKSVNAAYTTQDSDVSGQLGTDSGNIKSEGF